MSEIDEMSLRTGWTRATDDGGLTAGWVEAFLTALHTAYEAVDRMAVAAGFSGGVWAWVTAVADRLGTADDEARAAFLVRLFSLRFDDRPETTLPPSPPPLPPDPGTDLPDAWADALAAAGSLDGLVRLGMTLRRTRPVPRPEFMAAGLAALDRALGVPGATKAAVSADLLAILASCVDGAAVSPVAARPAMKPRLAALGVRLSGTLGRTNVSRPPLATVRMALALLLVETVLQGRMPALAAFFSRLPAVSRPMMILLGETLVRLGLYDGIPDRQWRDYLGQVPSTPYFIELFSALLGLGQRAPRTWNARLFDLWLRPAMTAAADAGRFTAAMRLLDGSFPVKVQAMGEVAQQAFFGQMRAAIEPAATRAGTALAPRLNREVPLAPLPADEPLPIAFVTTEPLKAMVRVPYLTTFLHIQGLSRHQPGRFSVHLYCTAREPPDPLYFAQAQRVGMALHWLAPRDEEESAGAEDPMVPTVIGLRRDLAARGIPVVVFFHCNDVFNAVASQIRLAPVQALLSLGLDLEAHAGMDGLLSALPAPGLVKTVGNRQWHIMRSPYRSMTEGPAATVAAVRQRFAGQSPVFGTIGRAEKLASPGFIAVLATLLAQYPRAIFLWTGLEPPREVLGLMDRHGITHRCCFLGQVFPGDYLPVIDVFLDTFPGGGGASIAEAMAMGVPVVALAGVKNCLHNYAIEPVRLGWYGPDEQRTFEAIVARPGGGTLYTLADTPDHYVELVRRLVDDAAFRQDVIAAGHALAEHFVHDQSKVATRFAAVIDDLVHLAREMPTSSA